MKINEMSKDQLTALVVSELIDEFYMSECDGVEVELVSHETTCEDLQSFTITVKSNDVVFDYKCLFDIVTESIIDMELVAE